MRKVLGKSANQKMWDELMRCMSLLYSHIFKIQAKIKVLEMEHSEVKAEMDEIICKIEELNIV